jgi:predicted Zn-dependent protease
VLANLPATQPTAPASVISDEPSVLATGAGVNSAEPVQVSDAVGMPISNGPLPTASDEEPVSPVRGEFDNGKIQPAVPSGTSEGESVRPVSTQAGEGQEVAPVRMKLSARLSPDNSRPFLSPAAAPPASRALPAQAENSAVRPVAALEPQMGGAVTRAVHQVDDFRGAQPQMAVHAAEAAPRQTISQADPAAECRTRGQLHLIQGRVDQALAEFTQAIALAPGDAANHRARADAYQASGNLAAAYDDLTEAIRLNPNDAASLLKRGMNAIERQLSTRAAVDFDAAVRLEPANSQALLGRGMAYRRLGQNRMAIDDLNEALRLDPALSLAADELKLAREALEAR